MALGAIALGTTAQAAPADAPPPGVQILLPRGAIPAVHAPQFVTAGRAQIPDTAWVLGITLAGESHAYSLNLLNRHEVVNDSLAGRPIAAVW